ncbi:hypothetical protein F5B22DRAFT_631175 [Xylaria bambusicola]|uniref:uncharacterized protein n=1 Tax=Xylaria bambusicola TaxID=326684 RepID=UPI002008E52A|nr:uncharacterized protein F5B22DRAFT_631175 [Xylaria bambusicola]KAI0502951.1 hypothetical protein F5B22DRAFT_631175 [Xylaria bambusicola]
MKSSFFFRGLFTALSIVFASAQDDPDTGEHPDWPRWCGKVYQAGYPSFEPGGHTVAPPTNDSTFLHVQFKPRYSLYLSTESKASFVVNAALSPWHGEEYVNSTSDGRSSAEPFTELVFSINLVDDDTPLVQNRIAINTTGAEFEFELAGLEPKLTSYEVVLFGASVYGDHNYTATSELLYLPDNPEGSATKIDNVKGGLLFKNAQTGHEFVPLLPYGYYGLYNGSNDTAASDEFVRDYTSGGTGLNAIVSLAGFADTNPVYDSMDQQGLHFMFDLRGSYKNLTETEQRVNTIKHHTSLFAYWTADEPDGWQVPFDKTPAAQSLIHALDPYHPVAITLNCQDYYFGAYASGGDILMEDVYPIGINSTFSKWGTACNATLGDCGCDNCAGVVQDVSSRLDDLATYEARLGRWPLPKFHNPQVFHGEDYWFRDPTAAEARAMNALAFNRGATGIFGWTWPGSRALFEVHSRMAGVVTRAPVVDFLLGGKPGPLAVEGFEIVDAACWIRGDRMMVSVVHGGYDDIQDSVSVPLPVSATGVESVVFGGLAWQLLGGQLVIDELPAMSTSFIILNIEVAT